MKDIRPYGRRSAATHSLQAEGSKGIPGQILGKTSNVSLLIRPAPEAL